MSSGTVLVNAFVVMVLICISSGAVLVNAFVVVLVIAVGAGARVASAVELEKALAALVQAVAVMLPDKGGPVLGVVVDSSQGPKYNQSKSFFLVARADGAPP